jgi:hypothetical protein
MGLEYEAGLDVEIDPVELSKHRARSANRDSRGIPPKSRTPNFGDDRLRSKP